LSKKCIRFFNRGLQYRRKPDTCNSGSIYPNTYNGKNETKMVIFLDVVEGPDFLF